MSISDVGVLIAIVLGVARLLLSIRNDRALRRGEARQRTADEWSDAVVDYADHIADGLREHVRTHGGHMYPEYEVPRSERRLAHAAVERGLLSLGTVSGQVTLPGREATPSISAVGLYHRGGIFG
jgi:hypothetical protein